MWNRFYICCFFVGDGVSCLSFFPHFFVAHALHLPTFVSPFTFSSSCIILRVADHFRPPFPPPAVVGHTGSSQKKPEPFKAHNITLWVKTPNHGIMGVQPPPKAFCGTLVITLCWPSKVLKRRSAWLEVSSFLKMFELSSKRLFCFEVTGREKQAL